MARKIEKEIQMASIELIRSFPFYGHTLVQLPKIYVKNKEDGSNAMGIPTMGVGKDGREELLVKLYVNKDYVQKCYDENNEKKAFTHVIEVLKHEMLHIVLGHLSVQLPDKNRSGIAADLAVNSYCDKDNFLQVQDPATKLSRCSGVFPEDYDLEPKKSLMWYYNQLLKNEKYKQQCQNGQFGMQGLMSDAVDSHGMWKKAQEDPMLEEMVKDLVRASSKICRETNRWGNIPGDLLDQLEDLTRRKKAIVPWQHVLRMFCTSAMESRLDYTMKRRSRRFGTRPGTKKEDILHLAVGVDTSGSISNDQLCMFFNELECINKNGAKITVIECDTRIGRIYPYEKFDGKVTGRGGTELEPVLEEVEGKYDALIYFTDFYAPNVSRRYNIPTLWILSQCGLERDQYPYPWGRYLKITDDNKVIPA